MQIVYLNKDKRGGSRETDSVNIVICLEKSANIWKKNILEDLKAEVLEYIIVGEFLVDLKREFGREDNEIKMVELKKVKKRSRTIEKFVQEFRYHKMNYLLIYDI